MKNTPTDNIILHMCTKNNAHMMYDSWDMKRDRRRDGRKKFPLYRFIAHYSKELFPWTFFQEWRNIF